jgi:hypothetical protein
LPKANQTIQWIVWSDERRELRRAATASLRTVVICVALTIVTGCVGPMRQGEAQVYAAASLRKFCRDQPCGTFHLVAAQKLKGRWLVDYESPSGKYTVAVDAGGNTQISVWDKSLAH